MNTIIGIKIYLVLIILRLTKKVSHG